MVPHVLGLSTALLGAPPSLAILRYEEVRGEALRLSALRTIESGREDA